MSTSPVTSNQGVSGVSLGGAASSVDLIVMIEMMLLQDYDAELGSLTQSVKENMALKQKYRDLVADFKGVLAGPVKKNDAGEETVGITDSHLEGLKDEVDFRIDRNGQIVGDHVGPGLPPDLKLDSFNSTGDLRALPTTQLENLIERYENKIAALENQGEIFSLRLQSVVEKRRLTLETITNIMKSEANAQEAIIRNLA